MRGKRRWVVIVAMVAVVILATALAGYHVYSLRRVLRLVDELGGDDEVAVTNAKNALILSKSRAVTERLVDALGTDDRRERDRVIAILVEKGPLVVGPLVERLEKTTPQAQPRKQTAFIRVWWQALLKAGIVSPPRWTGSSASDNTREAAAAALGRLRDARAVPALISALQDDNPFVVQEALTALGRIGDPAALPALTNLAIGDKSGYWGYDAVETIAGWGEEAAPHLAQLMLCEDVQVADAAAVRLGANGALVADEIVKMLDDKSPHVRMRALMVLAATGDTKHAARIRAVLDDGDSSVRSTAAFALARLVASEGRGASTEDAQTPAEAEGQGATVPEGAAKAAEGTPGLSEDGLVFVGLLDDEDPEVRVQGLVGLANLKETAAGAAVRAALKDAHPSVREAAIRTTGAIGDRESADLLCEIMESDENDWFRNLAAMSLADLGDSRARRVPFQDIAASPQTEKPTADAWNEEAASAILDALSGDAALPPFFAGQILWPSKEEMESRGGVPSDESRTRSMKWLRKMIRPEYLPDGIGSHLVSLSEVNLVPNYVEASLVGARIMADFGEDATDAIAVDIMCTANIVRFKKGDYVVQILDTPYDVIVVVADERTASSRRSANVLAAEVAKAVLRDQISRVADEISSEMTIMVGYDRNTVLGMQMPRPGRVRFSRDYDRRLRLYRTYAAALGVYMMKVDGDGRFVRFDLEKADLRGEGYFMLHEMESSPLEELPPEP